MFYRPIRPDFVIVPDIVAGGLASLAWSAFWRNTAPAELPESTRPVRQRL
jgi:hypothetical protein